MSFQDLLSRRHFIKQLTATGAAGLTLPLIGCDDDGNNERTVSPTTASVVVIGPHREGKTTLGAALSRIVDVLMSEGDAAPNAAQNMAQQRVLSTNDIDKLPEDRLHGITAGVSWHHIRSPRLKIQFVNTPGVNRYYKNHVTGKSAASVGVYVTNRHSVDHSMAAIIDHLRKARRQGIQRMFAVINDNAQVANAERSAVTPLMVQLAAKDAGYADKIPVYSVDLQAAANAISAEPLQVMRAVVDQIE